MYRHNQEAGVLMDLLRSDGDKGIESLPFQLGCAMHKFQTFRRTRSVNGHKVGAYIKGPNRDDGHHPGLVLYLNACRAMTLVPQNFWLDLLIERHADPNQEAAFRCGYL